MLSNDEAARGAWGETRSAGHLTQAARLGSRCIIHVGMHKSGSTSIQRTLDGFEDENFSYASIGSPANHSLAIHSLFASQSARHHLHQRASRDAGAIAEFNDAVEAALADSITRAGRRALVISGEDIGLLSRSDLSALADYFRARFETVEIVAYVRPPVSFMASAFQEHVKWGLREFNPRRHCRSYRESFLKFDHVFGRENVHLWKFDPKHFPNGCVVEDFCRRLGLATPKKIVRLNESLSRQAVGLLYTYFQFAEAEDRSTMLGPKAMELGQLIGGDKFRFSPKVTRPILQANRHDREWIEARLGESLAEDFDESQDEGVREEADLLRHDEATLVKLLSALGCSPAEAKQLQTPREVAELVQAWGKSSRANNAWAVSESRGQGLPSNDNVFTRFISRLRRWHR